MLARRPPRSYARRPDPMLRPGVMAGGARSRPSGIPDGRHASGVASSWARLPRPLCGVTAGGLGKVRPGAERSAGVTSPAPPPGTAESRSSRAGPSRSWRTRVDLTGVLWLCGESRVSLSATAHVGRHTERGSAASHRQHDAADPARQSWAMKLRTILSRLTGCDAADGRSPPALAATPYSCERAPLPLHGLCTARSTASGGGLCPAAALRHVGRLS